MRRARWEFPPRPWSLWLSPSYQRKGFLEGGTP
jgi:hypothetical protein